MTSRGGTGATLVTVVFVVGHLQAGGPIMQLFYVIAKMRRDCFRPVVFVSTQAGAGGMIEHCLRALDVEIVWLRGGKLRSILEAPRALSALVRRAPRTVLHPYGFRSDIICGLIGFRPRLGNVRNNLLHNYQRSFGRHRGRILAAINLFFLRRADVVVSCGTSVQRDLRSLGLESIAIRNAIDPELYRELMCSERPPAQRSGGVPTYLTVASAIPGKNVEFLVERFASYPEDSRRLVVIGRARPELIARYESNPNIDFRGHVSQPGGAILDADFFISASEHEGMPNAVLEALALGRPVVLSDIPSHAEVLDAVGAEVGALFTPTAHSLDAAIAEIESQNHAELSSRCIAAAEAHLSAGAMARRYEEVYLHLVSRYEGKVG